MEIRKFDIGYTNEIDACNLKLLERIQSASEAKRAVIEIVLDEKDERTLQIIHDLLMFKIAIEWFKKFQEASDDKRVVVESILGEQREKKVIRVRDFLNL